MRTRFLPLFTLRIAHSYYAFPCRDFRFLVPGDSARLLRNGRLLSREVDGVLHLLYEADDAGAPLARISGATLRFVLQLVNAFLPNFTSLPADFPTRKLRYTNAAAPGALAPAAPLLLIPPVFRHRLSRSTRPVTARVLDGVGEELRAETLGGGDTRGDVAFDLRGVASGPLTLEEVYAGETVSVAYHLDGEMASLDAAGLVEITIADGHYVAPPAFEIALQAREEPLGYYVVARNYSDGDLAQLSVADVGFAEEARPQIAFQRVEVGAFTLAELSPALVAGSGEKLVLFRSEDPLARRERARGRIQLSRNGDVLIANLPQPGPDRARADLIIHLAKP
jgi:hypothetical protein